MWFLLSKIFAALLSPLTWIIGMQAVTLFIYNNKVKKKLIYISLALLMVFTNPALLNFFYRQWEAPIVSREDITDSYDFGIVPGGISNYYFAYDRLQFGGAGDRLFQALELYKEGKIKKIILTGGSGKVFNRGEKEMVYVKQYLERIGVAEEDILAETESRNTYENARNTAALFGCEPCRFLLVTSAFHMPRALGCFQKQGLAVDGYPVDFIVSPENEGGHFINSLWPSAAALAGWNLLIKEWAGYIAYRARGYL